MIYKFISGDDTLEISHSKDTGDVIIAVTNYDELDISVWLDSQQLYDVIGALHSLQNKTKEVKNG